MTAEKAIMAGRDGVAAAPDYPEQVSRMTDHRAEANAPEARLLVVDDNEDNRYTLMMRLEIEGYSNIAIAEDGEQALDLLRKQNFDLVLLDVMMPKVDGYQVLSQLKAEGRLHDIPVIMISALNEIDSVVRCIELGAVDYLSKPFNPVLLKARVGASLEKKRLRDEVRAHLARMEEELESARQLQMSMVPTTFPQPTARRPIEISAMMEPAREVGGDLYDFYDMDDGTLCFFIGDVSGKGVPAALFMARTKNVIRLVSRLLRGADGAAPTPADIVTAVNRELCQDNVGMMFVTLFFGMLDPQTGDLRFTNAGHNPPYHLNGNRPTPVTACKGRPLGVRDNSAYETGHLTLAPGEEIYLYTDGVTEAADRKDEFFTEERLEAVLRDVAGHPANAIIKAVADAVRTFADGAPQSDDITALAIRRVGGPSM
jgi:sigma-B regulation protein RsbU (phosphoserine phosphatase)